MGTPLPPNVDGDPCTICWGVGKPFGAIATPQFVEIQLSAMSPGEFFIAGDDSLLLTPHLLRQDLAEACSWGIVAGDYIWNLQYFLGQATSFVRNFITGKSVYENAGDPTCLLSYSDTTGIFAGRQVFGSNAKFDFNFGGTP